MNLQMNYDKAPDPVLYLGCFFHSLLELKFVLSIEDEYRFLREPVKIGYDPRTLQTTSYFRENTRIYTPDFLVRRKNGLSPCLIEIKPAHLRGTPEIQACQLILRNYIVQNRLDWSGKIIFSDAIFLTADKQKKMDLLRSHKGKFAAALRLHNLDRKYNQSGMIYSSSVPSHPDDPLSKREYVHFVKFGHPSKP
jgi:hypothetical protein